MVDDVETGALGMGLGGFDVLRRWVDACNRGAEAGQRLCDEPAAAADVEQGETIEAPGGLCIASEPPAKLVANISQPDRVDAVERLERAVRIPPFACEPRKAGDLVPVEVTICLSHGDERPLPRPPCQGTPY